MEILLVMILIAGVAWWAVLRDKSAKETTLVAPYKLEPSTESIVQTVPQEIVTSPVVKKVRKPRTPKVEKEIEKPIPKKVAIKKAIAPKQTIASIKTPKSKKS